MSVSHTAAASLTACCMITASAAAQTVSPMTVDLKGDFFFGYGGSLSETDGSGEAADHRHFDAFQQDFLLKFKAETTFHNGVTAGVLVRLRAADSRGAGADSAYAHDRLKDAYIKLSHPDIGDFRLGTVADARQEKGYYAPQICNCVDGFLGSNSPAITFNNGPIGTNSTAAIFDGRATKAEWFSPLVEGFQLALSYAPDQTRPPAIGSDFQAELTARDEPASHALGDMRDFVSTALSYDHVVNDIRIGVDVGFSHATRTDPIPGVNDNNPTLWNLGTQLSYGPWTVGGAYERQYHGNFSNAVYGVLALRPEAMSGGVIPTDVVHVQTIDLGFTYEIGPATLGLAWSRGLYEGIADPYDPKRAPINDIVFGGASYLLGRGVTVLGGLQLNNYDAAGHYVALPSGYVPSTLGTGGSNNPYARSYTGLMMILGSSVRF